MGKEPLRTLATYRRDTTLGGVTFGMNGIVTTYADTPLTVGMRLRVDDNPNDSVIEV